jgi:methylated-DNA-protein-cysteine methyltransferase-like protein
VGAHNSIFARIRSLVSLIPPGKVTTYGQVAKVLGIKDARVVGWALHGNRDASIPCHRVVNKEGKLAKNYALGRWQEQRRKLLQEGVIFKEEDIVDLTKCFFCFDDSNHRSK